MHFTEFNGARKPANGCHLPIFKMDSTLALLHNYQINYYNCDDHLHYGHHHHQQHHHALYIPHEEQDGRHASGRITVTPHI